MGGPFTAIRTASYLIRFTRALFGLPIFAVPFKAIAIFSDPCTLSSLSAGSIV